MALLVSFLSWILDPWRPGRSVNNASAHCIVPKKNGAMDSLEFVFFYFPKGQDRQTPMLSWGPVSRKIMAAISDVGRQQAAGASLASSHLKDA